MHSLKLFLPLLAMLVIAACGQEQKAPAETNSQNDQGKTAIEQPDANPGVTSANIVIKRKFDYSNTFINGLIASGITDATLDGDKLILDSIRQYNFPEYPGIFLTTAFFGHEGDTHIKLITERVNQSTISYTLLAGPGHDLEIITEGGADLSPDFYLSNCKDTNQSTGQTYPVDEYIDIEDNCRTVISIGNEEGQSRYHARIIKSCNGVQVPLVTDQPVLLTEK